MKLIKKYQEPTKGIDTGELEEYYPIWLDGITVKPSGNRPTTRDDWNWANWRELLNKREQQAAESVRRSIDRNGTPIAAGIYGLAAAPFAIEGLGSSAVTNGVRTGLQAMNTAFTPSTWLNPVTGTKLLSPTVGTIADAGIQGAFTYEGLNGLWNQGKQGTLLSDPESTIMHGLEVLPLVGLGSKAVGMGVDVWNRSGMKALWDISRNDAPVSIESSVAPRVIEYASKVEPRARLDLFEKPASNISKAERAGIPKGDRNLKTINRPNRWFPEITKKNAYRVSDALWDAAYNKAVVDNNTEVQRLRDLHFYAKTGETPTIMYRGSINPTLRNTYYRDDGSAIWLTPDYKGAAYYRPPGTDRPPRAHYVKTKDGNVLHINGGGNMWSNIPPENIPEEVLKHLGSPNKGSELSKLFPEGYTTGDIVHGAKLAGYKQVDFQNIIDAKMGENFMSKTGEYPQFTTRYYNNIKLADPITYDDTNNVIPLSKRDNFSNPDIRYGILPWIFGGSALGYRLLNQNEGSTL